MFVKEHNVVPYLRTDVPEGKEKFVEMIKFLQRTRLAYVICVDQGIFARFIRRFWSTVIVEGVRAITRIRGQFVFNREFIINEETIRNCLRFGNDGDFPTEFEEADILQCFEDTGYEGEPVARQMLKGQISSRWRFLIHYIQHALSKRRSGCNDMTFHTTSKVVSLVENRGFNMYRYIFNGLRLNIEGDRRNKFFMYPRLIQCFINHAFPELVGTYHGPITYV